MFKPVLVGALGLAVAISAVDPNPLAEGHSRLPPRTDSQNNPYGGLAPIDARAPAGTFQTSSSSRQERSPSAREDIQPASVSASVCSALPTMLATARQLAAKQQAKTTLYVGSSGGALLDAFNRGNDTDLKGDGLFAMELVDYDEVIIGAVTSDKSVVCDPRLVSREVWDVIRALALLEVAALTTGETEVAKPAQRGNESAGHAIDANS